MHACKWRQERYTRNSCSHAWATLAVIRHALFASTCLGMQQKQGTAVRRDLSDETNAKCLTYHHSLCPSSAHESMWV